jgi:hypothetical protein
MEARLLAYPSRLSAAPQPVVASRAPSLASRKTFVASRRWLRAPSRRFGALGASLIANPMPSARGCIFDSTTFLRVRLLVQQPFSFRRRQCCARGRRKGPFADPLVESGSFINCNGGYMGIAKGTLNRIAEITQAWESHAPSESFSGLTLEQFKEGIKPSLDVRAAITECATRSLGLKAQRAVDDAASLALIQRMINGVKGDPKHGEDGRLYAAMGFVRKSERSSGLTRRRSKEVKAGNGAVSS